MLQQQEREQSGCLRLVGHEVREHAGEVDCLLGEVAPHEIGAGRGAVTLVEEEVHDREHCDGALGEQVRRWHAVRDAGVADLVLGAHEALGHRRLGHQKGAGDLGRRESDHGTQRQRDLRVEREGRMAAGEHEAQEVVVGPARLPSSSSIGSGSSPASMRATSWSFVSPGRVATQRVDRLVARHGREPRTGTARNAVAPPSVDGEREGVLRAFLGEVPVAGGPDDRADHAAPFVAEGRRDRSLYISQSGLTSIEPTRAPGIFPATSIASSRSLQSTR